MKICSICKIKKEKTDFNKKSGKKDGLQSDCKECSKKRCKAYYNKNKPKMLKQIGDTRIVRLAKHRQMFFDLLKNCSCIDCGIKNPVVLDFDHKDGSDKKHEVSKMVHDGYSWDNIVAEINKCEVRCANCHRIKTANDQNWYKNMI